MRPGEAAEYGFVDPTGHMVIPPLACRFAEPFRGDLARIQDLEEDVWYLNRQGKFVWPVRE